MRPDDWPPGKHWPQDCTPTCETCGTTYLPEWAPHGEMWVLPDGWQCRFNPSCWFVVVEHQTES